MHTVLSVGYGEPGRYHFSPAREHDSRHLQINASWEGCGLLADLAYASSARLRACHGYNVRLVIRLKDDWKPKVHHRARGQVTQEFFPGTDPDALLDGHILGLDGRAIDADVRVGNSKHPLHLRLGGVNTPKGYGFCLTNLPPKVGPRQVADLYRVRWEVELRMKVDKSVHRLDQLDAERPCAVKTRLHASPMASMIAARLAHSHHMQTRPSQEGSARTEAPLRPRHLALQLAVSCQSMAQAFDLTGTAAQQRWQPIAALLTHRSKDHNWRRRPSVLDQLRGWKCQPVACQLANRGHLKAAASVDTYGCNPMEDTQASRTIVPRFCHLADRRDRARAGSAYLTCGRFSHGRRPFGEPARARRPTRHTLSSPDGDKASTHRGPLQRQRPNVYSPSAASG